MRLFKAILFAALVGSVAVIGCGDDETTGTGGTGGGTGGTGGGGGNGVDLGCDEERCATDTAAAEACDALATACITEEVANEEECIAGANLIYCDADSGGGGTGGAGTPPEPEVECDEGLCATDDDLRAQCESALAACIAATPEANWDECVLGVQLLICRVE